MSWLHHIIVSLGAFAASVLGWNHPVPAAPVAATSTEIVASVTAKQSAPATTQAVVAIKIPTARVATFHSDIGQFSIKFPGAAELSTSSQYLDVTPYTVYTYTYADIKREVVYITIYSQLPNGFDYSLNAKGTIAGAFPEILNSIAGTIAPNGGQFISSQEGTYQGYPSDDYVLYSKNNDVYFKCRTILVKAKEYTLITAYRNDENKAANEASAQVFLDSLEIGG